MEIRTEDGMKKVAGSGTTALGIIGTTLGATALAGAVGNGDGGILGNLFGNGNKQCYVSEAQFYNQQIADIREMYGNLMATNSRICDLESRVSGDEISIAKNFEIENIRSGYENQLWDAKLQAATCDFVKAKHFLSPSQIADPYHGANNYIATYSVPFNNCGWNGQNYNYGCGCGCNGW